MAEKGHAVAVQHDRPKGHDKGRKAGSVARGSCLGKRRSTAGQGGEGALHGGQCFIGREAREVRVPREKAVAATTATAAAVTVAVRFVVHVVIAVPQSTSAPLWDGHRHLLGVVPEATRAQRRQVLLFLIFVGVAHAAGAQGGQIAILVIVDIHNLLVVIIRLVIFVIRLGILVCIFAVPIARGVVVRNDGVSNATCTQRRQLRRQLRRDGLSRTSHSRHLGSTARATKRPRRLASSGSVRVGSEGCRRRHRNGRDRVHRTRGGNSLAAAIASAALPKRPERREAPAAAATTAAVGTGQRGHPLRSGRVSHLGRHCRVGRRRDRAIANYRQVPPARAPRVGQPRGTAAATDAPATGGQDATPGPYGAPIQR